MKIIHQNGFTKEELLTFRPIIYKNVLDSAQAIVHAMREIGVECVNPSNQVCDSSSCPSFRAITNVWLVQLKTDRIVDYKVEQNPNFLFSEEIAEAIYQLSGDPITRKIMDRTSEFYLMDSAS
jgi:guanine nucleotide-binding protein G(i) subunit alpha